MKWKNLWKISRKEEIFPENEQKTDEEVDRRWKEGKDNCLVSKKIDLTDYLKENDLDIIYIVETKFVKGLELGVERKSKYNIGRKDREEGKGGVILGWNNLKVKWDMERTLQRW